MGEYVRRRESRTGELGFREDGSNRRCNRARTAKVKGVRCWRDEPRSLRTYILHLFTLLWSLMTPNGSRASEPPNFGEHLPLSILVKAYNNGDLLPYSQAIIHLPRSLDLLLHRARFPLLVALVLESRCSRYMVGSLEPFLTSLCCRADDDGFAYDEVDGQRSARGDAGEGRMRDVVAQPF